MSFPREVLNATLSLRARSIHGGLQRNSTTTCRSTRAASNRGASLWSSLLALVSMSLLLVLMLTLMTSPRSSRTADERMREASSDLFVDDGSLVSLDIPQTELQIELRLDEATIDRAAVEAEVDEQLSRIALEHLLAQRLYSIEEVRTIIAHAFVDSDALSEFNERYSDERDFELLLQSILADAALQGGK